MKRDRFCVDVMVGLIAGVIGAGATGCASGGPNVGGFGLLQRHVKIGEIVELSSPYDPQTGLEWRIASYDSAMLAIRTAPRVVQRGDGYEMVAGFQAKLPGTTEVVFERRPGGTGEGGGSGGTELRKFTINIYQ
jgi:hypothetical protein